MPETPERSQNATAQEQYRRGVARRLDKIQASVDRIAAVIAAALVAKDHGAPLDQQDKTR